MEKIAEYQQKIVDIISRHMENDGAKSTSVPSLFFLRQSYINEPQYLFFRPSLCVIVQGEKEICLAENYFRYGQADYLISSIGLPVTGQVTQASKENPYLSLKLEFEPNQITDLVYDIDKEERVSKKKNRAMYVGSIELRLMEAIYRLVQLVDTPEDIAILAPVYTREIFYRVLMGRYGEALRQFAIKDSCSYKIREVVKAITENYNQVLHVCELAQKINISVPTLHRQFKEVTSMSPLQFQKHLRLRQARQLMLVESMDAASAAFQVGYESPSQFSREYSRLFGSPPVKDIQHLKLRYV
ncbi:HTH-type transcriptional activator RhaS [Sporomusa silvacetica DSM 10669]|uniref:HTH-type transcriptional activator RhaS n=1 Tax=Sporomusa silvacetica DSM 10669 TaxID=1123289 RepID=A0ABZ3IQW0_9FIRM|nr:AraC family transcriptional regulator [Sporomusa silvacetica]OZC16327.1 HTH-type transcriptional regulator CdhR [Sporomusa silvacetica DSM 10669]